MNPYRDINDEEWQSVAPLLPELRPRSELRGRARAHTRAGRHGVLGGVHSGATWSAMPRKYPSYQTCHRRFKVWYESGVLKRVMEQLFGADSEELCRTMEARMRTHLRAEEKAPRPEPGAPVVAPVVYAPPPAKPVAPSLTPSSSAFGYVSPFTHAA
jgi:transposase